MRRTKMLTEQEKLWIGLGCPYMIINGLYYFDYTWLDEYYAQ